MFVTNALLALVILAVSRVIWEILRRFVLRSPLDNIRGPALASLLTGNFQQLYSVDGWGFHNKLATEYGPIVRLTGVLGERQLYVADPKALHNVVVKDQHVYEEHPHFISANTILFGEGLLTTLGDHHKKQRKLMNPVFSTAHMRDMIPIFWDVVGALRSTLEIQTANGPTELDMLHWMGRTALELIGRSGLGYSFDSLTPDEPAHPYAASVKELVPTLFRIFTLRVYVLPKVYKIGPAWLRRAVVNILPSPTLHDLRDKIDLMWKTSNEIYAQKIAALRAGDAAVKKQVGQGKDIISLLIRANMKTDDPCSEEELLGQMSTLIFAAMDTTSSALSRTVHLLATHPDVQDRLRAEIRAARKEHGARMSYDQLETLPYLDALCRETLRLYPPIPQLLRKTRKDVVMPFGTSVTGVNGQSLSEVFVPKGTPIIISVINANRSREIWGEDALEWKPERWLAPLPDSVAAAHVPGIYSHLMTFLGGGRACIGFKFSQLEMKVVLVELLDAFEFKPSQRDVQWRMSNIVSAFVKDQPQKSQLPIVVSKAL
ncbi:cytochrome P450 [Schizophyllum amplum]|uniref:Cytochrome P450 n=1 Tax=Schizophyllum amplum TaxID=97359 RepID=A0A550C850_9AGAR|nr:cytochrome P450 [Auriculariopsis ampla]